MNVVTSSPEAACSAVIPRHPDEPAVLRTRAVLQPTSRGVANLVLVIVTVALALGLAAVTASLAPTGVGSGGPAQERPSAFIAVDGAPREWTLVSGDVRAQPPAMRTALAAEPTPASLAHVGATGPWVSPLYPQNGVTLWDRIRVSSRQDRPAFLLGTAIQIHAAATAATPGP